MGRREYAQGRRDWKWTGKWDTRQVGSADYRRGVRDEQANRPDQQKGGKR